MTIHRTYLMTNTVITAFKDYDSKFLQTIIIQLQFLYEEIMKTSSMGYYKKGN